MEYYAAINSNEAKETWNSVIVYKVLKGGNKIGYMVLFSFKKICICLKAQKKVQRYTNTKALKVVIWGIRILVDLNFFSAYFVFSYDMRNANMHNMYSSQKSSKAKKRKQGQVGKMSLSNTGWPWILHW